MKAVQSRKGRARRTSERAKFRLESYSLSEQDHPGLMAAMREETLAAIADFPKNLELLKDQLRQYDPVGLMACFAGYGLMAMLGARGVADRKLVKNVEQHHAELLQALILTIPRDQWGSAAVIPDAVATVFDCLPKLSDVFFSQRRLKEVGDEQELAVRWLQERISLHTAGVRNWGYFGDVVEISKELYCTVDTAFAAEHGFSCTDLIEVMRCVVSELDRRQSQHWDILRKILRGRNPRQIFRLYFKYVPELIGSAEEMLAAWPAVDVPGARAAVMAHYDLRLADCAIFEPHEIGKLSGRASDLVARVFQAISLAPGSLAAAKTEYLFLGNPIWETPIVDLGDAFFLPMPQAVFSHIHRIIGRLAGAGIKEMLEKARSDYLQKKLETTLRSAFPDAHIRPGAKWKIGDQVFETDVLALIDRTVVVAEAKANRLTPEGLRGAPARVKRHVQDMVLAPSLQSERLTNLIAKAQSGDTNSVATVRSLGVNPEAVDRVIRLSVTLDDFSVLSSAEGELKKVGWVPADHELAPTIQMADLLCVIDILEKPLLVLHYLSERAHLQKTFTLLGDELDFLGLYIETGFNVGVPVEDFLFTVSGMSSPIDRYYTGRDAGLARSKPKPNLSPLFSKVIDRLAERRPERWTTVGLHVLSAASPSEQHRFERSIDKLRASVRKNYHDPAHVNSLQIQPAQKHKARVGFYLFPEQLRAEYKNTMKQLCAEALDTSDVDSIVLFARCTERWELPYEAVLYSKRW
ncbi:hypothetical protein [Bradyrhizobium yuanmingense]|uniref:hypothetical protein n=1 Tax=Bradyrhizobium yuanmingense TaxID=108015 RepID=UPI003517F194